MLIVQLLLFFTPLALTFTIPTPPTLNLNATTITRRPINLNSHNVSSGPKYWRCTESGPALRPTTYDDCDHITLAILELDPTGLQEFLFSPRSVADIQLPYSLRWGTCVLDVRGVKPDSWDFFAIGILASAVHDLAETEIIYPRNLPLGARTEEGVPRPNRFGISDYEDLRIPTPDGETLSAFFIRPSNKRIARRLTVLMFHGNAGNIGHRVPIAKVLEEHIGCNVLMLEYRGYGLSTGTPNEDGINIDAQTAIDYIRSNEETRNDKIIIYGESIGGACAVRLVANNQDAGDIAGLILVNTFTSIRKLIPSAFPPARYIAGLCHQYWNTEEVLPQITKIPIIFMSGLRDEIVP
ncbi:MAG: hypothetical protein Q9181_005334 [Wetmoreana brouardii]